MMKQLTLILGLFLCFSLNSINAQTLDTENSIVEFQIGNMRFRTVKGTFGGMKGTLGFDANDLAKAHFNVCVDAATVSTGNNKRDKHLRNEDFFHVEQYPTICFESSSIEQTADGYLAKGTLTMHGISKAIDLPFSFDGKTFKGELEINRFDYNIGVDTGTFMVSQKTAINILCVLQ